MITYQDWLEHTEGKSEAEKMGYIRSCINDHKSSEDYKNALLGEDYFNARNTTINKFEKWLYTATGQKIKDTISPNHKLTSRFFYRDVTQANAVLLGNGIKWKNGKGGKALGDDFDRVVIDAGRYAQVQGKAYGFFNLDHVDIFYVLNFKPFVDEEDGLIKAGIRFWQLADNKPLRATLFELDGYTEYIFRNDGEDEVMNPKRGYKATVKVSEAEGEQVDEYQNYPSFPIVPLYSNDMRQSELLPLRNKIDAIDLISSGYANNVDEAFLFWTITNAGGMDDKDLVETLDKLRKLHAAQLDGDQIINANTVEAPYQGREALLERLEKELYMDAMAFNPYDIARGAATATQIEAAYDPLDEKLNIYERHISEFIAGLLSLANVQDEPTYDRDYHTNKGEAIDAILKGALYLDDEYITEKILVTLGDKDKVEEVMKRKAETDMQRMTKGKTETEEEVNADQEGEQEV